MNTVSTSFIWKRRTRVTRLLRLSRGFFSGLGEVDLTVHDFEDIFTLVIAGTDVRNNVSSSLPNRSPSAENCRNMVSLGRNANTAKFGKFRPTVQHNMERKGRVGKVTVASSGVFFSHGFPQKVVVRTFYERHMELVSSVNRWW